MGGRRDKNKMVLTSTFSSKSKRKKSKRRGLSDTGRLVSQGATAIIGVGLLGVTADAVGRI